MSRGSAGDFQADELAGVRCSAGDFQAYAQAGVAGLSWRVTSRGAGRCRVAHLGSIGKMSRQVSRGSAGEFRQMIRQVSRGSAGEY